MNTTQTATCKHCDETIMRSTVLPIWSHFATLLAGSTRCANGETKAEPE